jgi:Fn3 associated
LTVKPRGSIRWNLEGTNPREGKPYTGPIPIPGEDEVKIYAYAEDAGVEATKTFTIRPVAAGAVQIDLNKPVVIKSVRKLRLPRTCFRR